MKNKNIFSFLFSTRLMSVAILAYAIAMAVATFIENDYGTPTAKSLIYNTKWFELLMFILTINFIGNVFRYRLYRREKWPVFLFHIAFVIILLGSFTSRYFGFEGVMPIREGKVSNTIYSDKTYITVRVDDNKGMATYSQPVLFGQIGRNNYQLKAGFGAVKKSNGKFDQFTTNIKRLFGGIEKNQIPFKVEMMDYVYKAKEVIQKKNQGKKYIHIVESSSGSRNDIFLAEGETKNIQNMLFTFNNSIEGGMNIINKNGNIYLKPVLDGNYMEMKTRQFHEVKKDSLSALQIKKLYTFGNLRFVIKEIKKGTLTYLTASKKEQPKFPYDALNLKVSSGNEEKLITVKGAKGAISKPKFITLNGLNFYISYGSKEIKTPFSVKLRDFQLERYPGIQTPSSYASEVTVIDKDKTFDYRIFMNNVLDYKGYRLFQSSFDPDEKGTVLSVNHDYWGTLITYIGYLLMAIGMFFSLFWKGTHFQNISKKLDKLSKKRAALFILILSFTLFGQAQNHPVKELSPKELQKFCVSKEHAAKFGHLIIQGFERMEPMNTYALQSLRKIYGKDVYKGLTAEQVVLSAQVNPTLWANEPIIKAFTERLGSKINTDLGFKENHSKMINFFKNGSYYLEHLASESGRRKKIDRDASDNEIINLDEKVNIWYSILDGNLLKIYPKKGDKKWYSGKDKEAFVNQDTMILKMHKLYLASLAKAIETNDYKDADDFLSIISKYQKNIGSSAMISDKKIDLEIKYNHYNIFFRLLIVYFNLGLILLILVFVNLFKPQIKWVKKLLSFFVFLTSIALVFHIFGLGLRWYISDHAPWSNGYEATVFIASIMVFAGLIFSRKRSKFIIAAAVLFAGFLLGIAHGSLMSPQMSNLVPVLKSYWLMVHVAVITMSYAFLGLGALLGFFVLLLFLIRTDENKHKLLDTIKELSYINEMTITIGLYLLSIGTFLGGIWANESWGRYWSWDPKEVWALISMMVYIFILHMRLVPGLRGKFALNFASMISIATLIMTYLGVNYYLSGMHSYGKGDPVPIPNWIYYFIVFVVVFSIASYIKYRKIEKK